MDRQTFDNEVVCRAVYAWVKGDGPEPYSPVVASLTVLVGRIVDAERARVHYEDMKQHKALIGEVGLSEALDLLRQELAEVRRLTGERPSTRNVAPPPHLSLAQEYEAARAYVGHRPGETLKAAIERYGQGLVKECEDAASLQAIHAASWNE